MPWVYNNTKAMYGNALKATSVGEYNNAQGHGGFGRLVDGNYIQTLQNFVCPSHRNWSITSYSNYTYRVGTLEDLDRFDILNWKLIDDRGAYWIAADYWVERNHAEYGINVLFQDSHVSWAEPDRDLLFTAGYSYVNGYFDWDK
jgi:hypothetical protein